MSNASSRGAFVWHELMTSNPEAAGSFYGRIVGWKSQTMENDSSYTMFAAKSGPVAGYMSLPEEAKAMGASPHWLTYILTTDVDETAREAERLGGRVVRAPDDIPGMGRFAILQDPFGALFATYASSSDTPVPEKPSLGEFSWHELATGDVEAAFEFYRQLFGWVKTSAMDMGPELGVYQMFGRGGLPLGGIYKLPANMPAPPNWLPYAMVPDAKHASETIRSLGGQILNGPMEVPGGDWIVMAMDPQGVAFAVHSTKPAEKKAPAKPAAAKKPAKKAAKRKSKKAAKRKPKKAAKKSVRRKAARKPKRKKAAKKPTRRKAARKPRKAARKPARRKAARKKARRPARGKSRTAKRGRIKKKK
jgi:predicted enzyme related to lactoylglutathione lyase